MREIEFDIWCVLMCVCAWERCWERVCVCVSEREREKGWDWTLAGGTSPVPDASQRDYGLHCEMVTAGQRGILAAHLSSCPMKIYPWVILNCSHLYKLYMVMSVFRLTLWSWNNINQIVHLELLELDQHSYQPIFFGFWMLTTF